MRLSAFPVLAALLGSLFSAPAAPADIPQTMRQPARLSPIFSREPFSPGFVCTGIQRQARLLTPEVVVGEPVAIEILLTGRPFLRAKAEFYGRLEAGRDIRIWIKPPRGAAYEFAPPALSGLTPNLGYELREGETVSAVIVLAADKLSPNGAFAYGPGDFMLRVAIECLPTPDGVEKGGYEAIADLALRVLPAGPDDEAALAILDRPGDFLALQAQRAADPAAREKMARIVAEAPNSRLRPYALAALANHWFLTGIDRAGDPTRLRDAIPLYEQFLREHPDHVLTLQTRMRLVRSLAYLEETGTAASQFLELWRDPGFTKVLRPREELRVQFLGEPPPPIAGDWMLFVNPEDALKPDSGEAEREAPQPGSIEEAIQQAIQQITAGGGRPVMMGSP